MTNPEIGNESYFDSLNSELFTLKNRISNENNNNNLENNNIDEIFEFAELAGINKDITDEYIGIISKSGNESENLDKTTKDQLGFENIAGAISYKVGLILFFVKKTCPNNFKEICPFVYDLIGHESANPYAAITGSASSIDKVLNENDFLKRFMKSFETYGDSIYEYLKFCSPLEGRYIKNGLSHIHGRIFGESYEQMKLRQKKKIEDERKKALDNEDDEDKRRKLIENKDLMINRLQQTLDFFQKDLLQGYESDSSLTQFIENFTEQSESVNLFNFLKDNPQKLSNLGGKEIKEIDLDIDKGINFAFRGIIEMVKSRPDIDFPRLNENPTDEEKLQWKEQRETIIREYEKMLRKYIEKDNQKERPFDKIFFTMDHGYHLFSDNNENMPSKEWAEQFTGNEVSEYSIDEEELRNKELKNKGKNFVGRDEELEGINYELVSHIKNYVQQYPDHKILICVNHHGSPDGSSGNGWSKEDWLELANISPNIKIWSIRCYFGNAFDNENIYNQKSSLSGFSNETSTNAIVSEIISEAWEKNLGFHEMEIYTRLHYPVSVTPLTESMEYTNQKTKKPEIGKIGLAQNDNGQVDNLDNDYV